MTSTADSLRRRPLCVAIAATAVAVLSAGCAEQGTAAEDSPVSIGSRNAILLIENRLGQPLNDILLTVVPFGKNEYSKALSQLAPAERREVPLSELASRDGTTFIPMLNRPRLVRVSATDPAGRRYDVELPWR